MKKLGMGKSFWEGSAKCFNVLKILREKKSYRHAEKGTHKIQITCPYEDAENKQQKQSSLTVQTVV